MASCRLVLPPPLRRDWVSGGGGFGKPKVRASFSWNLLKGTVEVGEERALSLIAR